MAPAPDAASTPPAVVGREQRLEQRRLLEHRAQVQRRTVGDVHELGGPHDVRDPGSSASARWSTGSVRHRWRRGRRSRPRPVPPPVRGARRRRRSGARGPRRRRCAARSSASNSRPPGPHSPPPDEGERTGDAAGAHGGGHYCRHAGPDPDGGERSYRLVTSPLSRSTGGRRRWRSSGSVWWVPGSWAPGWPRWPPRRASRWCCAAARSRAPTRMLAGLDASLARQVKKGRREEADATEIRARVTAVTDLGGARRLRSRPRVDRRGPRHQAGALPELDRVCAPDGDPRHQHVDAPGGRDGR